MYNYNVYGLHNPEFAYVYYYFILVYYIKLASCFQKTPLIVRDMQSCIETAEKNCFYKYNKVFCSYLEGSSVIYAFMSVTYSYNDDAFLSYY